MQCCIQALQSKVVQPIRNVCQEKLSTAVLLASCVAAAVGGVWPVPLTTWIPCTFLNYLLGGHLILTQTLNLLMTPANIASIIPFKVAGEWILGASAVDISIHEVREDAWGVLKNSPLAIVHAAVGWSIFCLIAIALFFTVLRPLAWCCGREYHSVADSEDGACAPMAPLETTPLRVSEGAGRDRS